MAGDSRSPIPGEWIVRDARVALSRPILLGILNVTPDSFSDGGRYATVEDAVVQAERMIAEGADIIDIGGESTRPQGARLVDAAEELRRVIPVLERVRRAHPDVPVSVDTTKGAVAREALAAGARIINDVSAFRLDPSMSEIVAAAGAGVILMHSRGGVSDMATFAHATYGDDVAGEAFGELATAAELARHAGVAREAIVLDPGIGFAKRGTHSLAVLAALPRLVALGYPVAVGVSRKRFIGEITGVQRAADRVFGTVGANVAAFLAGARLFRVHDVAANRQALDVVNELHRASGIGQRESPAAP